MNQDEINAKNAASTAALAGVIDKMSEADLTRDLGEGWTIATALYHVAFWDRRAAILLGRWEQGLTVPHDVIPWYDHVTNETLEPALLLLPATEAPRLCLESARLLDATVQ